MSVLPELADHHVTSSYADIDGTWDYILIGGGGTAAAFIDTLLERRSEARVLVLEQGRFLLPSHAQNLGLAYQPLMASAAASPWSSDGELEIVAQVPYLGGRTLMWSGSCPQPTGGQLRRWPSQVVDGLDAHWDAARRWVGVRPAVELGPEFATLHRALRRASAEAAAVVPSLITPAADVDLDAPLAYTEHVDGSRQKFAAIVPLLRAAAHQDSLRVVTDIHVQSLAVTDGVVTAVRTAKGDIEVHDAEVVLTSGSTEATAIVLRSTGLESEHAGANLAANAASFFTCRIPRASFAGLAEDGPELAALYIEGETETREFHLHVSAVATTDARRDMDRIYHLMPDMFGDGTPQRVCDPNHVVLVIHGLAEIAGGGTDRSASTLRIEADADAALVGTFRLDDDDRSAWDAMDAAVDEVLAQIAGDAAVEYWNPEIAQWQTTPPSRRMPFAFHETGTLWMGSNANDSASDLWGKVHGTDNLFVLGGATFPTRGSWNPFLTMVALTRRLVHALEDGTVGRRRLAATVRPQS